MRKHGSAPHTIAVLHGGPGAAGEVRPLAEDLAKLGFGVLEPLQAVRTLDGQIDELFTKLSSYAPLHIVGWSWGAWLGLLTAARHPHLVKQLILVGSGPLREEDATATRTNRQNRLTEQERDELKRLSQNWDDPKAFAKSLELYQKMDAHTPNRPPFLDITYDREIHRTVWRAASEMRRNGQLMEEAARVKCPILILHGDYGPHPAAGVIDPLCAILPATTAILFEKCGHKPWEEKHARVAFLKTLGDALGPPPVARPAQS